MFKQKPARNPLKALKMFQTSIFASLMTLTACGQHSANPSFPSASESRAAHPTSSAQPALETSTDVRVIKRTLNGLGRDYSLDMYNYGTAVVVIKNIDLGDVVVADLDAQLATCNVDSRRSRENELTLTIGFDPEIDDGLNVCGVEVTSRGKSSKISLYINVND